MAKVSLVNISKYFGGESGLRVVHDVNLEINDGELIVLVGPSGCGKTTTLRMLAGLERPSSGQIRIGSRDVTALEPKDRNIAMVFQNYALYPQKTVYENMAFGLRVRRQSKAEIDQRVKRAATILGLQDLLERKPRQLSGGQMQRVALGRALVRQPDVFLLDEPLSNLDAKLRVKMREEIAALHAELKVSMVYVTHDQIEAMTLGDRIVVMRDGLVQQVGRPLELYDSPANLFVASFIGSPEMNCLNAEFRTTEDGIRACIGQVELDLGPKRFDYSESAIFLGIRPEHIVRADSGSAHGEIHVRLVEQIGTHTYVLGTLEGQQMRAVLPRDDRLRSRDRLPVRLPAERVHLFSRSDQRRLRPLE